ncbi:MAG: motility associated factor glycosyltransferase family protein, partial [Anaerolineae bacterium]
MNESLESSDVLCVYGIQSSEFYSLIERWLSQREARFVVLVFDHPDEIQAFFASEKGRGFLERSAIRPLILQDEEALKQIAWEFVFLHFSYLFSALDEDKARSVQAKIEQVREAVHLVASDYRDLGSQVLKNVLRNAPRFQNASFAKRLEGCFSGIPAIICGAGPSLDSSLACLKELRLRNRALIFAGGASLNALSKESLLPHFSAGLDPSSSKSRFLDQDFFETPFFYQSRLSSEVLDLAHGPLLWVSDSGGYPIEKWIHERLGVESAFFEGGWNVATLNAALSVALGCNPIIFVGMDLCSQGQALYAANVQDVAAADALFLVENRRKEKVRARRDWIMAADWIRHFTQAHPQHSFFSTALNGLDLGEITYCPLSEIAEEQLKEAFDLEGMVHRAIQTAGRGGISEEIIADILREVETSRMCSLELCREIL